MAEYDFSDLFSETDEEAMENPNRRALRLNAGRHVRGKLGGSSEKIRGHGAHYLGPARDAAMLGYTKDELVRDGSAAAVAELRRRGRGPDGVKLAWGTSAKAPKASSSSRASSKKPSGKGAKGRAAVMRRAVELRAEGYSPADALRMAWAGK